MKSVLKKELLISLSFLFCFIALGMFSIANGVETFIKTDLSDESLHKIRLNSLFLSDGNGDFSEIKVNSENFSIDNGLVVGNLNTWWYNGFRNGSGNWVASGGGVIGGGRNNYADGGGVGGGWKNAAHKNDVVGGGNFNGIVGENGVIGGGERNRITPDFGVIVGGLKNYIKSEYGLILGGGKNVVFGKNALLLGKGEGHQYVASLSMCDFALQSCVGAGTGSFAWRLNNLGGGLSSTLILPVTHSDEEYMEPYIETWILEHKALINSKKGVLIGTNEPIDNVSLVVDGTMKVGNWDTSSRGGGIVQSGGCIYTYGQDGYDGNPVGKVSSSGGICGDNVSCTFGKVLIGNGDTVTGYVSMYSTGKCQGTELECNGGVLRVLSDGNSADGYYTTCYEIGTGVVFTSGSVETCTIEYDCNGGSGTPNNQTLIGGHVGFVRSEGCVKDGGNLVGWSTGSSTTTPTWKAGDRITCELVGGNATLFAVYGEGSCGIDFWKNDGSSQKWYSTGVICGFKGTAPENSPNRLCYTFAGWHKDPRGTLLYDWNKKITNRLNLYAKWTPDTYTITYDCNGGNEGSFSDIVTFGEPQNVRDSGCTSGDSVLAGWSKNPRATTPTWFLGAEMDGDLANNCTGQTIYAVYSDKYIISFIPDGGIPEPSTQLVKPGERALIPTAPEKTCYTFGGWYTNASFTAPYNWTSPVVSNLTLYAKWTPKQYKIKYSCNGGKPVSLVDQIVTYGSGDSLRSEGCFKTNSILTGWSTNSGDTIPMWPLGSEITGALATGCDITQTVYAIYVEDSNGMQFCEGEVPANAKIASGNKIPDETIHTGNRVYIDEAAAHDHYCAYVCKPGYEYVENYGVPQCVTCKPNSYGTGSDGIPTCQVNRGCNVGFVYGQDDDVQGGYSCQKLGSCSLDDGTHPEQVPDENGEQIEYKYVQPIGGEKPWSCTTGDFEPYQCQYKCKEGLMCKNDGMCGCEEPYHNNTGNTGCYLDVEAGKYKVLATGSIVEDCPVGFYSQDHQSYFGVGDSCRRCTNKVGGDDVSIYTSNGRNNDCERTCQEGFGFDENHKCVTNEDAECDNSRVQGCKSLQSYPSGKPTDYSIVNGNMYTWDCLGNGSGESALGCFKCFRNYTYNNDSHVCEPNTRNACVTNETNITWINGGEFIQTWSGNGTEGGGSRQPAVTVKYNPDPENADPCDFMCINEGVDYERKDGKCVRIGVACGVASGGYYARFREQGGSAGRGADYLCDDNGSHVVEGSLKMERGDKYNLEEGRFTWKCELGDETIDCMAFANQCTGDVPTGPGVILGEIIPIKNNEQRTYGYSPTMPQGNPMFVIHNGPTRPDCAEHYISLGYDEIHGNYIPYYMTNGSIYYRDGKTGCYLLGCNWICDEGYVRSGNGCVLAE